MTSLSSTIRRARAPRARCIASSVSVLSALLGLGCSSDWQNDQGYASKGNGQTPEEPPASMSHPTGLHAVDNHIEDADGNVIRLRGVNRSGTEYKCVQGDIFDGASDKKSVEAMATWNVNAVRVPLNETCWLGINGVAQAFSGEAYKSAISDYIGLLHAYSLIPILELHWTAPGEEKAISQPLVPDLDHAPDFWADVTRTFADDTGVIFEPFNEPVYNYLFQGDAESAWACWRDGCTVPDRVAQDGSMQPGFAATGFQGMLDAIRGAEAETGTGSHLVLQGGLDWSNDLSGWLEHRPDDPAMNLGAAWHIYNFNGCNSATCFDGAPADVAAAIPLVATEIGENDCQAGFVNNVMDWLDAHDSGYLAWSWNTFGPCEAGSSSHAWSLVQDYYVPTPNSEYAQAIHDRLRGSE